MLCRYDSSAAQARARLAAAGFARAVRRRDSPRGRRGGRAGRRQRPLPVRLRRGIRRPGAVPALAPDRRAWSGCNSSPPVWRTGSRSGSWTTGGSGRRRPVPTPWPWPSTSWRCCSPRPSDSPSARGRRRGDGRSSRVCRSPAAPSASSAPAASGARLIRRLEPFDVRVIASTHSGAEVPGAARSLRASDLDELLDGERLRRAVRTADA